jgi:hypothetical protein
MAGTTFLPSREADLISFSKVFDAKITADPTAYGLTPDQAAAYTLLQDAFVAAWEVVQDPDTRTTPNTQTKDAAKEMLINGHGGVRELVKIIQANPNVTNTQRAELQITIPDDEHTPVDVPDVPPDLSIISVFARTIKVRLEDQENPTRRAKPAGVQGATILYHVGATAPSDPAEWTFAMNTSTTTFDVDLPASVPAGSQVWLSAFWFNARKDASPAATPESACISDGLAPLANAA